MKLKKNVVTSDDKEVSAVAGTQIDSVGDEDVKKVPGIDSLLEKIEELEAENKKMKDALESRESDRMMKETLRSWIEDGDYLSKNYPGFDLDTEARNPAFLNLLRAGADLKSAYYAIHHDDIVKKLLEETIADTQSKTVEAIRARSMRPLENGMSGKSTALFKTDVSKLTPAQREEIAKRVARGETITF